jgi:hypothetical protein
MKLGFQSAVSFFPFLAVETEELGKDKAWSWVRKGPECLELANCSEMYSENVNWFRKIPISPTCEAIYSVENGTFP